MSNSTCLRADLENSNIGSVNKSQAPSKKKPDGGLNEVAYSQPKATQKHHPFRASGRTHSKHEGANMKCKPKQNQTGELLWRDTGGIHWRMLASRSGSILAGYSAGSTGKGYSAAYSAGSIGGRDARRDPLASYSGLSGIHWRATLTGYSAGSTGELLWDTQRDAWEDPLMGYSAGSNGPSRSGGILGGILWRAGILGGIHWPAALAGYSAGSTGEPLWLH